MPGVITHRRRRLDPLEIGEWRGIPITTVACTLADLAATATLDDGGVLNYEVEKRKKDAAFQCVKCHVAFGKRPIPETHLKALEAAK